MKLFLKCHNLSKGIVELDITRLVKDIPAKHIYLFSK